MTMGEAWLAHYLHNLVQYGGLIGLALGAIQFYRTYQRDRRAERDRDVAWRTETNHRIKELERHHGRD